MILTKRGNDLRIVNASWLLPLIINASLLLTQFNRAAVRNEHPHSTNPYGVTWVALQSHQIHAKNPSTVLGCPKGIGPTLNLTQMTAVNNASNAVKSADGGESSRSSSLHAANCRQRHWVTASHKNA